MLTPDYLAHCADDILNLYQPLQDSILRDIVRRIIKNGLMTKTAAWQAARLQEVGMLYSDTLNEVSRLSGKSQTELAKTFQEAGLKAVEPDIKIYEAAGLSPPPLPLSPSALKVLTAGLEKTGGYLNNLTMTTAEAAQELYIKASTLAEMQIESGAFDYATAIKNAVKAAADGGVKVKYPTGHVDKLDVAVRRAVLTGVGQTTGKISLAYANDMGCDLMEITAHSGARPTHAAWQGRLVSLSGRPGYLSTYDIGYGTGPGFKGWNCRHDWFPFFDGLSESAYPRQKLAEYENQRVTYNGKQMTVYDASQRQRALERRIRETKNQLVSYDEAIKNGVDMQAEFSQASLLLKKQEALLKDFVNKTGLRRDTVREQKLGFGKSTAQKAVHAYKHQLLPNNKKAVISNEKFTKYALNKEHTTGRDKAVAFEKALGYNVDNANELIANIHKNIAFCPAKKRPATEYGQPFDVTMNLTGPNGKTARVKTGWIIDKGAEHPRLTSAYVTKEVKK